MSERFTFFFRKDSPFSQWHPAPFVVNGRTYNCMEQYMMAVKARMFGDAEAEARIMATADPAAHKAIGRSVKNFVEERWRKAAPEVIRVGSHAKYEQNPHLLDALLRTAGTTLVEASPYDRIYGIGLSADAPEARNRKTWRGANVLGETLTTVRDTIVRERT